jgi:hypothetical protein
MSNLSEEEKQRIYKLIEQINANTDYLCAKQFYNYLYRRN